MSETISVSVSGATFSLLFYENIKSEHDQDGFLIGDISSKETNKLTDADLRVVNKERIIKINSIVPCPKQFYFYNSSGNIDLQKIRNFLGDATGVVGWYIFKRKRTLPSSKLTLREKIIHKQLAGAFCTPSEYFSCCLLTSDSSNIKSTYSFCQTFVRYFPPKFEGLPLHINNLSDPSYTFKNAEPTSDVLTNIIKGVKSSSAHDGHSIITHIQDGLQQHMKNFLGKFVEKEQELFKLEQEVKQLAYNLKMKREYGSGENEDDGVPVITEVTENGTLEHETSQTLHTSIIQTSPEVPQKKRGRPRKLANSSQHNITISPSKTSDNIDDYSSENEGGTPKCDRKLKNTIDDHANENEDIASKSNRRLKNNFSYAEAAQKKKT